MLASSSNDVDLRSCRLGDSGVAALAMALSAKPDAPLQTLSLMHTGAGERAARALATVIATNGSLQKLLLRSNPELKPAHQLLSDAEQQRAREGDMGRLLLVL